MGALVGIYAGASRRTIATVMALGAGVLISSVAFELMDEAYQRGGFDASALGLLLGAVAFFFADTAVNSRGGERRKNPGDKQGDSASAIAIGALMDGIPESAAIGISLLEGGNISAALVAAVFLSNVPEGSVFGLGDETGRTPQSLYPRALGRGNVSLCIGRVARLLLSRQRLGGHSRRYPGLRCRGHPDHARKHHDARSLRGRRRGRRARHRRRLPPLLRPEPPRVGQDRELIGMACP